MKYIESINSSLHDLMRDYPEVYVIGEDIVDPYGGAFRATKGLSTKYPIRVITTPICEASIVGLSIGMALRGLRPITEIMFGDFLGISFDQILNHASKYVTMYNGKISLPLTIRTPMGGGRGYGPTHSQSIEKYFMGMPNIEIVSPSLFHDAGKNLVLSVLKNTPTIFIENKLLYPEMVITDSNNYLLREESIDNQNGYPIVVVKNFRALEPDITIVAYGGISRLLNSVLIKMIEEEIRITAIIPCNISPITKSLIESINNHSFVSKKCLLIEESSIDFGWTAELASQINQNGIKIVRLGSYNSIIPSAKALESKMLISEEIIIKTIIGLLRK